MDTNSGAAATSTPQRTYPSTLFASWEEDKPGPSQQDEVTFILPPFRSEERIVGESDAANDIRQRIEVGLKGKFNFLIEGEYGVGKTFTARAIHSREVEDDVPLVAVNCTAVEEGALHELLLGDDSPVRADSFQNGVFSLDCGTILLQNVGELPDMDQAKLEHILEVRASEQVDQPFRTSSQIRLISTLNEGASGDQLRSSLYYKLSEFPIQVAPLRNRPEDIPALCHYFLRQATDHAPESEVEITDEALRTLKEYSWPGNIEQLRKVVKRAAFASDGPTIRAGDLFFGPDHPSAQDAPADTPSEEAQAERLISEVSSTTPSQIPEIETLKKHAVERAYDLCDGDVDHAAVDLGIGRSTMYRMLDRYGIK
jgi:DNA-binding NtrC family response regulator